MKVRLGITYMRVGITIDEDLARGAKRQPGGTVLLPHAVELLERQWVRDEAGKAHGEPSPTRTTNEGAE
jgi:hypothetical protein